MTLSKVVQAIATLITIACLCVVSLSLARTQRAVRLIPTVPYAYSVQGDGWYTGKREMLLQDENGQVYLLDQMGTNSNVYTVWQLMNETNGITNTFAYRMGWLTNGGNYFENPDGTGNIIGPIWSGK